MKNFFKSIFIFFIPIFIFVFVFFTFTTILSLYVVKKSKQYAFDENLDILFLGDSHVTFSVNDSIIKNASNESKMAEPYYYTLQKLKYIYKNQNISHVFVGFSYHNISFYYNSLIDGSISSVFPKKIFFCLDFIEKLRVFYWNKIKLPNVLIEIINSAYSKCENLELEKQKYSFSDGYYNELYDEKAVIKSIQERIQLQFYKSNNHGNSKHLSKVRHQLRKFVGKPHF